MVRFHPKKLLVLREFSFNRIALPLLISLLSVSANAALIQEDSSFGANTVILDTATGSSWLTLNTTDGQSYNHVAAQLGTTFAGYSIASYAQVAQFVGDAGVPSIPGPTAGTNSALNSFINLWGITGVITDRSGSENYTYAATTYTSATYPGNVGGASLGEWNDYSNSPYIAWFNSASGDHPFNYYSPDYTNKYFAVALVSIAAVPEARKWLMMITGLGLICFNAKRRKKMDDTISSFA